MWSYGALSGYGAGEGKGHDAESIDGYGLEEVYRGAGNLDVNKLA